MNPVPKELMTCGDKTVTCKCPEWRSSSIMGIWKKRETTCKHWDQGRLKRIDL